MPQTDVFVPNFFSVRRRELPPITPDIPAMVLFPFLLLIAKGFEGSESTFQNSLIRFQRRNRNRATHPNLDKIASSPAKNPPPSGLKSVGTLLRSFMVLSAEAKYLASI